MSVFLGIDVGTTSTKCLAADERGRPLALTQRGYTLQHPKDGWAEQDPDELWESACAAVRDCVTELSQQRLSAKDVRGVSVSAQGDTLILYDEEGESLRPAISWMDTRAGRECEELLALRPQQFWYDQTGQLLTPLSSACKVRWLRKNDPDVLKRGRVGFVSDYIGGRLTQIFATDISSASWTSLYNPFSRYWSLEVLDLLGIREDQLPAIATDAYIGAVWAEEVRRDLGGLGEWVFVPPGAFDQAAAAYGAGAEPGVAVLSCGTAWVLYVVSRDPESDPERKIPVCCHAVENQWGLVLPFTGGSAYDWARRNLNLEGSQLSGAEPPVFVPHLYGELCPEWRSDSRGSLAGLTMAHTPADIEQAVMRGLACEARRNIEAAERLAGPVRSVRMVGGAARSQVMPQLLANVLGRTVEVSEFAEAAAFGAAKLAAESDGQLWPLPGRLQRVEPDPQAVKAEERRYQKHLELYGAALSVYQSDPQKA